MSYLHTQPIVTQFTEFYSKCPVSRWLVLLVKKFRSYPNPKTNHRFDKTDWADFFDNNYEYEGKGDKMIFLFKQIIQKNVHCKM